MGTREGGGQMQSLDSKRCQEAQLLRGRGWVCKADACLLQQQTLAWPAARPSQSHLLAQLGSCCLRLHCLVHSCAGWGQAGLGGRLDEEAQVSLPLLQSAMHVPEEARHV